MTQPVQRPALRQRQLARYIALNLDLTTALDPRITFTRATTGSYYNSAGVLTQAAVNLTPYSRYELGQWTFLEASVGDQTKIGVDGTSLTAFLANATTSAHRVNRTLSGSYTANSIYTFSFYVAKPATSDILGLVIRVRSTVGGQAVAVIVSNDGANSTYTFNSSSPFGTNPPAAITSANFSAVNVGNNWTRISITTAVASIDTTFTQWDIGFSTTSGTDTGAGTANSQVFIDSVQLETGSVATTYIPTTSSISGAPRFDYDPVTLAPKGLLIEESRTNLLTYSSEFDNAAWSHLFGGTGLDPVVTSNFTTAPDGTLSADKIVFNSGAGSTTTDQSIIRQGVSTVIGTMYAGAIWLKGAVGGEQILFRHADNVNYTVFTLSTSWKRYDLVQTGGVTTTTYYQLGLRQGTGVGTINSQITIYIWGAQLEVGAFPTSYIPTTSATVTRAADVAVMTGTNFSSWYNQSEGTVYSEWEKIGASNFQAMVSISDGTSNNTIALNHGSGAPTNNARFDVNNGGVSQASITIITNSSVSTYYKTSGAYLANSFAADASGWVVQTDNSGSIPTVSQAVIGANGSANGGFLNGHIKRITYYNKRLANSVLQYLTR